MLASGFQCIRLVQYDAQRCVSNGRIRIQIDGPLQALSGLGCAAQREQHPSQRDVQVPQRFLRKRLSNKRFGLDMFNVVLGIIAQLCLTALPMYLVLGMQTPLWVTIILIAAIALVLKKTWWNKLEN